MLWARWEEQASLIGGLVNVFGYFTVLTNTLVATVLSYAAFGRASSAQRFFLSPVVGSGITASIVLVALAYSVLLRHLWQPQGWQWVADELLHDVMPLVCVLYWWREVPKGSLRLWHLAAWTLYPAMYFAYALWRGGKSAFMRTRSSMSRLLAMGRCCSMPWACLWDSGDRVGVGRGGSLAGRRLTQAY